MEQFAQLKRTLDCKIVPSDFDLEGPRICPGCSTIICTPCLKTWAAKKKIFRCPYCNRSGKLEDYVKLRWHNDVTKLVKHLHDEYGRTKARERLLEGQNRDIRKRMRESNATPQVSRKSMRFPSPVRSVRSMMKKIANKRTTKLPTLIRQNDAGESEAHELPDSSSGEEKADERRWTRSMARPQDNEGDGAENSDEQQ